MIRPARLSDQACLQRLWHTAFGDPPSATDCFFEAFYGPSAATVWEADDTVASAIYILDAGSTPLPDGTLLRTAYAYALATLPAYRNRGLGSLVTRFALADCFAAGFDCCLIRPATAELFPYYEKLGYTIALSITDETVQRTDSTQPFLHKKIMSTDVSTYSHIRQPYLPDGATAYPLAYLQYMAHTCKSSGGGLYRLEFEAQTACAAVSFYGDQLFVREFLPAHLAHSGTQALMAFFDKHSAQLRTTPATATPATRPFVLAATPQDRTLPHFNGYFPFVLD